MASVVRLKYGEAERSTRLVNNQLHKDMFGLSSVDIDGVAEPADDRGFTFASYMSGSVLEITGTPAQAAVLSGKAQDLYCQEPSLKHMALQLYCLKAEPPSVKQMELH